jgi:hypothetical protein
VDTALLIAALRTPAPRPAEPDSSPLLAAVNAFAVANARLLRADAEAAIARRPSTLKATLKSARALEQARRHLTAELRLVGALTDGHDDEPPVLRLCS